MVLNTREACNRSGLSGIKTLGRLVTGQALVVLNTRGGL